MREHMLAEYAHLAGRVHPGGRCVSGMTDVLRITGLTHDGREVPVFENGRFGM